MNLYFAKQLLGSESTEEKEQFLIKILQSAREGHLCLRSKIAPDLPPSVIEDGKTLFPKAPIIRDQDRYYLQKNWVFETYILEQIKRLREQKISEYYRQDHFVNAVHQEEKLSFEQKEAVKHLFTYSFSILYGGPGTGKTYTASMFVWHLVSSITQEHKSQPL